MSAPEEQSVDVGSLSASQLGSIKRQLDEELEHITNSFTRLRAAQTKFRECLQAIELGISQDTARKPILVPLTASLYVPGELSDSDHVIVDIGTGYYIEKLKDHAREFYSQRVDELGHNLKDLETIVQGKSNSLKAVEDVLRQRVIESSKS